MNRLPGKVRVRLNFVVDHGTQQRFKRQAKLRGMSLSDAFRHSLELLEKEHATAREVIAAAVGAAPPPEPNGPGKPPL